MLLLDFLTHDTESPAEPQTSDLPDGTHELWGIGPWHPTLDGDGYAWRAALWECPGVPIVFRAPDTIRIDDHTMASGVRRIQVHLDRA